MIEQINQCPLCGKNEFIEFLQGKDYFLSEENFTIQQCSSCGFRFTNPRPSNNIIGKYYNSDQYISHDSQKQNIFTIVYKCARYFAIRKKYSIIDKYSKGKRLLDIGCGTGELINYCSQNGYQVQGVEPNFKARKFAVEKYNLKISDDISSEYLTGNLFDCITLWHVLEHVDQPVETLRQITKLLTPEGILIIAVPNSNSWDALHYKKYWAAFDLPRHLSHFTYQTLNFLTEQNNYRLVKYLPQKIDAFYISLLSEQYKTGRKNLHKAIFRGLQSNFFGSRSEYYHSSIIFVLTPKISYF